jgi:hypothetical protein
MVVDLRGDELENGWCGGEATTRQTGDDDERIN